MKLSLDLLDKKYAAILIFLLVSLVYLLPIFSHFSYWGADDWDQHMFYHGSARETMLKYHQFPLWNPFYCGGNVMLANPQSTFTSPFFGFVLLFGTVYGLKIEALVFMALGMFGMWLLARKLGAKGLAAYVAPVIFMMSSWYALHLQAGHTTFFPFALMPFALLFYLEGLKKRKMALLAALVLALMLLSGGIYPFYFSVLLLCLHGLFDAIEMRKAKPIIILAIIFIFAFLFASIKLLPMLELVTNIPAIKDAQLNSPAMLGSALLSRTQSISYNDQRFGRDMNLTSAQKNQLMYTAKIPWGWHEYGAYIGIIGLLLALAGCLNWRKNWKMIALAAIFLLLSLGIFSPLKIWVLLQKTPFFGSLHGPSRMIIPFVFCAALLASKAVSDIKLPKKTIITLALLGIMAADFTLVARPMLAEAFLMPPVEQEKNTYQYWDYVHVFAGTQYKAQFLYMLYNFDTVNCYERIHLDTAVAPQFADYDLETGKQYAYFIGNAYLAETNQSFNLSFFSPNRFSVKITNVTGQETLVINQNYLPNWKSKGREVFQYNGLIAADISKEDNGKEITFYYLPASFIAGTAISFAGLCLAGVIFFRGKRGKRNEN